MSRLRYSNPTTSFAAAVENLPKAGTQRRRVLDAIRNADGLSREEVEIHTGLSGNAVRPRVAELLEEGHIEETERTRTTRSGSQATVLVATNSGVGADSERPDGGRDSDERGPGLCGRTASQKTISTDSGVEASVSLSRPPEDSTGGSSRPNPYEYEVWN